MQQAVRQRRHVAFSNLVDDLQRECQLPIVREILPMREVEVSTTFDHIVLDEPRGGSNVGINGPRCCIGVAVGALGSENPFSVIRQLRVCQQSAARLMRPAARVSKWMKPRHAKRRYEQGDADHRGFQALHAGWTKV